MNSIVPPPPRSQDLPSFIIQTAHYHKKYDDESTEKLTGTIEIYSSSFNQRFEFLSEKDVLTVPISTISENNSTKIARNRPKIMINLKNGDNFIFELTDEESRDSFREKIDTMLKIQKDVDNLSSQLRRNFTALSANIELCRLYISLIVRDSVLTPSEFWEGREDVIVEAREAERIPGIVSIEMQPDIFKVKNQKYVVNATSEAKKKLFLLYPSARRAFENCVPSKLSEKEFWVKFAKSDYFLAEQLEDADVKKINKFKKSEEEKLKQEMKKKSSLPSVSFPQLALSHNSRERALGQSHRGRRMEERIQTKDADTQKIENQNTESYKVVTWDRLGDFREEQIKEELKSGIVHPYHSYAMSSSQNNDDQLMPQYERGSKTSLLDLDLEEYQNNMEVSNHRIMKRRGEMRRHGHTYSQNFALDLQEVEDDRNSITQNIKISDIQSVARELASKQSQTKFTLVQEIKAEEEIKNMEIGDSLYQEVSVVNELLRHYWRANPVIGTSSVSEEKEKVNNQKKKKKKKKKDLGRYGQLSLTPKLDRIIRKLEEKYHELEKIEKMNTSSKHLFYHLKISIKKALKNHEKKKMKKRRSLEESRISNHNKYGPTMVRTSMIKTTTTTTTTPEATGRGGKRRTNPVVMTSSSINLVDVMDPKMTPPQQHQKQSLLLQDDHEEDEDEDEEDEDDDDEEEEEDEYYLNQKQFGKLSPSSPKDGGGMMDFSMGLDGLSPLDEFPQTFGHPATTHTTTHSRTPRNTLDDNNGDSILGRRPRNPNDGDGDQSRVHKKRKLD